MKNKNFLFIRIFFVFSFTNIYCQNNYSSVLSFLQKDSLFDENVEILNKRIRDLIRKKNRKLAKKADLEFIHIFYLEYKKPFITKEEVRDLPVFLSNLNFTYEGKDKWLVSEYYIIDPNANFLVAAGFYKTVRVRKKEKYLYTSFWVGSMLLLNLLQEADMDIILNINISELGYYLGIKDNQLFGIEYTADGPIIYDYEELINNHWELFF